MAVFHTLPNGEVVPVPHEIVAEGRKAEQSFYDNQVARIVAEGFVLPAPAPAAGE